MSVAKRILRRGTTALASSALVMGLALPPLAAAATVSVQEEAATSLAVLEVRDTAAESNELTIKLVGESGPYFQFEVSDFVAPVTPGPGCSEGGAGPISAVTCAVHKPGSGWSTTLLLDLGGGERNFLDASQLELHPDLPLRVAGGPGEDVFVGGGGNDVYEPGGGRNFVGGNSGDDEIVASTIADEGELYEGGYGTDRVSYERRVQPVHVSGDRASTAASTDQFSGIEIVRGGAGNDTLVDGSSPATGPTPRFARLEGGPGDDALESGVSGGWLLGGPGNDSLVGGEDVHTLGSKGPPPKGTNHLIGEEGDDLYRGSGAHDVIREYESPAETLAPAELPDRAGNDVAFGGDEDDLIELGAGADSIFGEAGDDLLTGGRGPDLVAGGEGNDLVVGDLGADRLFGGAGWDRLFAARGVTTGVAHPLTTGPYDGRDHVGCGRDRDLTIANPWDRRRGCERVRLQPRPKHRARR